MAEYFHIPPEGGWEKDTYYVCEVSKYHGNTIFNNLIFEAILYSGYLTKELEPGSCSKVFSPFIQNEVVPLKEFIYIKAIHKIDMTIPNKGKQIKELNIFELKDHMKERPNVRFD